MSQGQAGVYKGVLGESTRFISSKHAKNARSLDDEFVVRPDSSSAPQIAVSSLQFLFRSQVGAVHAGNKSYHCGLGSILGNVNHRVFESLLS